MSNNQNDSDKKHSGSLAYIIRKHSFFVVSILGTVSLLFIIEYYPQIVDAGNQIFIFCEKCWSIFNKII